MHTHLNKNTYESRSMAPQHTQTKSKTGQAGIYLEDNRPTTVIQQKLSTASPPSQETSTLKNGTTSGDVAQLVTDKDDLSEVAASLQDAARVVLSTPSGASLAAQSQAGGNILKIVVSTRVGYPSSGAHYTMANNTITVSQEVVARGTEAMKDSIRWELQNSESADTFSAIQAATPNSNTDLGHALHLVYHYEKTEYQGLVRHFNASRQEGTRFQYAASFTGGRQARWASFYNYLKDQVKSVHYRDLWERLGKGIPMIGEFEDMLTDADYVHHDWSKGTVRKYAYTAPVGGVPRSGAAMTDLLSFDDRMEARAGRAKSAAVGQDMLDVIGSTPLGTGASGGLGAAPSTTSADPLADIFGPFVGAGVSSVPASGAPPPSRATGQQAPSTTSADPLADIFGPFVGAGVSSVPASGAPPPSRATGQQAPSTTSADPLADIFGPFVGAGVSSVPASGAPPPSRATGQQAPSTTSADPLADIFGPFVGAGVSSVPASGGVPPPSGVTGQQVPSTTSIDPFAGLLNFGGRGVSTTSVSGGTPPPSGATGQQALPVTDLFADLDPFKKK